MCVCVCVCVYVVASSMPVYAHSCTSASASVCAYDVSLKYTYSPPHSRTAPLTGMYADDGEPATVNTNGF